MKDVAVSSSPLELIHVDPLILSTGARSSICITALHVAALLGHLDFLKEQLSRKPELAKALDSRGSTPLHLASAKGYAEMVKELLLGSTEACFVLDHDGRSPLHLAAIKGRVGILAELVRVKPESTRVLTGGGDTCLHLCVKYNRFEALKLLVECTRKDAAKFVNWEDHDGNTILHLAVAKKQIQIIKFLLAETAIEVNARNANGFTAMDVLAKGPRDLRDMQIKRCLQREVIHENALPTTLINGKVSSVPGKTQPPSSSRSGSIKPQYQKPKYRDWLGRKRSALMIVASLLATVAFQAGLSPPGGVWSNDQEAGGGSNNGRPHGAGQSVLAYTRPRAYGQFMIFNTIAFLASFSIILIQISGLPLKQRRWVWTQMVTMWAAISAQTATYFIAFIQITPARAEGTLFHVIRISVLVWLCLMGLVFIGNVVRAGLFLLGKYGDAEKPKVEEEPLILEDDQDNDDL